MSTLKYWKVKQYLEEVVVRPESSARMPTIRDLMGRFNVSLATVNRALGALESDGLIVRRQGVRIAPAGRNRRINRAMRNKSEGKILFAYHDYPDDNTWAMVHTIEHYSRQLKYSMVDCKLHPDTTTEELIDFIHAQSNVQGIVLQVGSERMDNERLEVLGKLPVTVVLVDSMYFYGGCLPDNVYTVSPDPRQGAEVIAGTLLAKGHRRIGFVRNEPRNEYTEIHQKHLAACLRKGGAEFEPRHVFGAAIRPWENSQEAAVQLTLGNLDAIRRFGLTALVYKSSIGALVSLKTLRKAGLRVPDDISVISEGDRPLYDFMEPGLDTVSADYVAMGQAAVDIALGKRKPERAGVLFPLTLKERESITDLR